MKFKLIIVLTLVFCAGILSQPKLVIGVTGGYNLPLPQLKGTIDSVNSTTGESYWVKTGYNVGLSGKYALDKKKKIRLVVSGSYNKFSGEETYSHTNNVNFHTNMTIISAGLGAEYSFSPREKTAPFIGLDLTGNFFSGKSEVTVTAASTSGNSDHNTLGTTTTNLTSVSRYGIALGGGVDVAFNKSIGALFGFKYHWDNLINKQYNATSAAGEYNLNDKESGSLKAKNIMYFQIYLGISFHFGQGRSK